MLQHNIQWGRLSYTLLHFSVVDVAGKCRVAPIKLSAVGIPCYAINVNEHSQNQHLRQHFPNIRIKQLYAAQKKNTQTHSQSPIPLSGLQMSLMQMCKFGSLFVSCFLNFEATGWIYSN